MRSLGVSFRNTSTLICNHCPEHDNKSPTNRSASCCERSIWKVNIEIKNLYVLHYKMSKIPPQAPWGDNFGNFFNFIHQ